MVYVLHRFRDILTLISKKLIKSSGDLDQEHLEDILSSQD